jgi:hypothetical protein
MSPSNPWRHPPAVPRCEKPRAEGRFFLPGGRRLGYAEFGDPNGAVVLWFHGTPGGRRQFPLVGRRAAERLGLRVVLIERPGSGLSDSHEYAAVADFARDMTHVADALGADRLGVVGLSGAAPTRCPAPRCPRWLTGSRPSPSAAASPLSVGPEATSSGGIDFLRRVTDVFSVMRRRSRRAATRFRHPASEIDRVA